jgi:putative hydrolase of the HAD superfamily
MTTSESTPIRGIIFDLDGTLYTMRWYMRPLFFFMLFPHARTLFRFLRIREMFAGKDMESYDNLTLAVRNELAKKGSSPLKKDELWIEHAFYPAFVRMMPLFRFSRPGIRRVLSSLKQKGIKLGVLSDYAFVEHRLFRLGLPIALFDTITSSEAAGALKPHAKPFLDVAQKWGIPPEQILVIGDTMAKDGLAAQNAGMQFQLLLNHTHERNGLRWRHLARKLTAL